LRVAGNSQVIALRKPVEHFLICHRVSENPAVVSVWPHGLDNIDTKSLGGSYRFLLLLTHVILLAGKDPHLGIGVVPYTSSLSAACQQQPIQETQHVAHAAIVGVRACFTGIWIESHEHQDALVAIAQLCRQEEWRLATWNIEDGLRVPGMDTDSGAADPLAAIRSLNALASPDGTAILVLQNFHRFIQSAEIVQALSQQIVSGKQSRTIIVCLSPIVDIPRELEKLFVVVEHELSDREQLAEIAEGIATEEGELPNGSQRETILDAAVGLTRYEAEAAFSLSLVREGRLAAETLWEQKAQMLKKSGLLSLHRGGDDFNSLGGLTALKAFCRRSLLQPSRDNPLKRPRGVLLLGVPETGKSAFAKALGQETGRPTLVLDVGALMGSLVGQTEQNVRQALKIADAMAPCILFCDEIEKALSGVGGSGQTDSGVSARLFGSLLSWMNDHASDVYLIATCNDISKLPPEFSRAERCAPFYG